MNNNVDLFAVFSKNDVHENLGLGYLKSFLTEHGVSSTIHSAYIDTDFNPIKYFGERIPRFVGFSVYEIVKEKIIKCAKKLKQTYPDVHICLGGPDVMGQGERILEEYHFIDSICNREGHNVLLNLSKCVFENLDYGNCKGITFRKDKNIIVTEDDCTDFDLDSLPFPSRDLFEKKPNKSMFVMSSRECYGQCTFCVGTKNKNRDMIKRSC